MYQYQNLYPQYSMPQQQIPQPQTQQSSFMMPNFNYQQPVQAGLNGRMVNTAEEITANEVPMNGSKAIFPLADNSGIIVKNWNADGTISTLIYEPKKALNDDRVNNSTLTIEKSVFDDLKSTVQRIEEQVNKLATPSRAKKKENEEV